MRNHPPDLINVALERIVEASLELPAYSTLDEMAAAIRTEVNEAIFAGITARMGPDGRHRARGLLNTAGSNGRSMFNRLKKPARRATWSRFKAQAEYLDEVDEIGDTAWWVEGAAPGKIADFAGEAAAQDIDTPSRYGDSKKLALVACLVHTARQQAGDDLAEMLCKRVAPIIKKAKDELEEIRLRQRAVSEKLIGTYRTVLESLDPDAEEPGEGPARAVTAVEEAGGFAAQLADIEEVSAYHGDNYEVLVNRFFRKDRAVMFDLAGKLELVATSSDASVLAALQHAHLDAAAALDAGYEDNANLVIGEDGVPALKRRRSAGTAQAAERLADAIERRMPERSLLSIVARTAYWLGWHHHFGPVSGSDPKISDPLGRYCMAVFTGGANIGPYEAARHIAGVSARELSMVRNRHIDLKKLNAAIATVVNAFNELERRQGVGRRHRGRRRRHPAGIPH